MNMKYHVSKISKEMNILIDGRKIRTCVSLRSLAKRGGGVPRGVFKEKWYNRSLKTKKKRWDVLRK